MSVETVNAPPRETAWWPTVSLALPMLLASLGVSIANIALPALLKEFSASFAEVQWVVLAYLLAATVAIVPSGYLGDRYGRGRVLLAGIALFTIASLACALAPTLLALIAARAVQGIGAAMLSTLTLSLVRDMSDTQTLGARMGILGSMSAIGTTLGPFAGGMLISSFGWPAAFLILVPPGALSFFAAMRVLPHAWNQPAEERKRLDVPGVILLAATLAAFAFLMTSGAKLEREHVFVLALASVAGGSLFVLIEHRTADPLINMRVFRNLPLATGLLTNILVSAVMMTTLVVGPIFLTAGFGFGAAQAGIVMSVGPAASMLSGPVAGLLADRFGNRAAALAGLLQMGLGSVSLALLPVWFGAAGYIMSLIVLTPGYQLFLAANNAAVMSGAAKNQGGTVAGVLNLSRNLGFIAGASAMGTVFALALAAPGASTASATAVISAAMVTYLAAGALVAAALVIALARPGTRKA